jgi:uncharacterized protein YbbC (DUF1343 family)
LTAAAAGGGAVALSAEAPASAGPGDRPKWKIETGLDALVKSGFAALRQQRVGVISNPTGVDARYRHLVDLMHAHGGLDIVGVFGPEHGFRGSAQAGGSEGTGIDARTGLTVYDAYGATQAKWEQMFTTAGVETVVFDIQDVGSRFYTYIWTMYDSMCAAAKLGLRYVILDRPNPVDGTPQGPLMTSGYTSGVGKREIVQQHGMTVGELGRFFGGEFIPDAPTPEVVRCKGWRREMVARDTDLPWVMPSPNMPTPDTALVYPGTGMFEGAADISEGRGTTRPFELVGSPNLDYHWCDRLNERGLGGVEFREAYFNPTFNKFQGQLCAGVEVKVTDAQAFDPIKTAVAMLIDARGKFVWRQDAWDPIRPFWIDKLTGSPRLRTMIDAGAGLDEVVGAWLGELTAFARQREKYLLY